MSTTDDTEPTINEEIRRVLLAHRGKQNAIPARELSEAVGITPTKGNTEIRRLVGETLALGTPIGSCQDGYYLLETDNDRAEYIGRLNRRKLALTDRIEAVLAATEGHE